MNPFSSEPQNPYASPGTSTGDGQTPSTSPNRPNEPLVKPIRIFGELSKEDYDLALKLGVKKAVHWANRWIFILGVFFWTLGVYVIVGDSHISFQIIIFSCAVIFITIAVFQWTQKRQVREAMQAAKGPFQYIETTITEESLEAQTKFSVTKTRWAAFRKYRTNDRVAVVHHDGNSRLFSIFSRSMFQTPEDWECFLGVLERNVPIN